MYLSFCVGFKVSLAPPQLCGSEVEGIWFLLVEWEEVGSWQPLRWGSFFLRCPLWLICCKIPWPWDFFFLCSFKYSLISLSSILWFSYCRFYTSFVNFILEYFMFDAVINRIVFFLNWGVIDINFKCTAWFDTCMYYEMITTISLNIHHHT